MTTATSAQLIPLTTAVVLRGQRAWSKIKATASEQRQLWKEIGEALKWGRSQNPSDRAFGAWVKEHGFDDMDRKDRADAMWLASNWAEVSNLPTPGLTHPHALRAAYRDLQANTPPTPELHIETPSRLTAGIEVVAPIAAKLNKLVSMAERGEGQEQATAQKYLARKAKDLGMEPEELSALSKKLDPKAGIPPSMEPVLEQNLQTLAEIVGELVAFVRSTQEGGPGDTPITKEFTLSVVLSAFNRLGA